MNMKTMGRAWARVVCAGLLMATLAGACWAEATTTRYPQRADAMGVPLVLSGSGVRHWTIFSVYEVALYLPRKATTAEEVIAMPGPKRVDLTMVREVDSTDLGRALVKGMRANSTPEQMTRHTPDVGKLIAVFSSRNKIAPGEHIWAEYFPGKGTIFFVGGQPVGQPVGDAEFIAMLLSIWVGHSPVEPLLKDALLAPATPAAPGSRF